MPSFQAQTWSSSLIPGLTAFPTWGWLQIIISKFPHYWALQLFLISHNYISTKTNIHSVAQVTQQIFGTEFGHVLRFLQARQEGVGGFVGYCHSHRIIVFCLWFSDHRCDSSHKAEKALPFHLLRLNNPRRAPPQSSSLPVLSKFKNCRVPVDHMLPCVWSLKTQWHLGNETRLPSVAWIWNSRTLRADGFSFSLICALIWTQVQQKRLDLYTCSDS